jgi:hypothetical protein
MFHFLFGSSISDRIHGGEIWPFLIGDKGSWGNPDDPEQHRKGGSGLQKPESNPSEQIGFSTKLGA